MATIKSARDVLLQAAGTRLGSVSLPVNVVVPNARVAGLGDLALQNTVNLATQITGALANSNVSGLGDLALQNTVNLATQITWALANSNVSGLGDLALQNTVNLATQITGALANSNVSGLGALALLGAVNLGDATVVGDLAATRIGAGTLAAGVIYAGTLSASNVTAGTLAAGVIYAGTLSASNVTAGTLAAGVIYAGTLSASNVTAGTLSGVTINIAGNFLVDSVGFTIAKQIQGGNASFNNSTTGGSTAFPAVSGTNTGASAPAIYGYSSYTSGSGHGIRGQNANGSSGLVGPANGYDFYAEGSGTNYGPFTGSHDALVPISTSVQIGQIVVDVTVVERGGISSTICEVALSTSANQLGAIGVAAIAPRALHDLLPNAFTDFAAGPDADGNPQPKSSYLAACYAYEHLAINAVGEGQVQVCNEGGDLAIGDLIVTSSTAGVGMKQSDDTVRSYTVARCREAVTFSGPGDIQTVACIYHCG